ncbi:MAG TPA: metalloregulator ArsR/SmtB family transcription factor [Micromonosporaceae bacterium]|nr:metalloregulator ArsR/SmtB family transcription factor [Micromonosporaceae bacterium]
MEASTALVPTAVEPSALLAVAADPVRWRLLGLLADGTTRCVCDLQPVAAVPANLLSYHLKVLRGAGLVRAARRGRWMDYTITPDALDRLHAAVPGAGGNAGADLLSGGPIHE